MVGATIAATSLLAADVIADPYPFYRQLHEEPVWRVPGTEVFLVSSYALIDEAVRRVEDFSSNLTRILYRDDRGLPARIPFGNDAVQTLATADPPVHRVHKMAIFPEFVGRRMTALEPDVVEVARTCIDNVLESGRADFMAEIGSVVPITMISRLIGFTDANLPMLLRAAYDSTTMLAATLSLDHLMSYLTKSNAVGAWIAGQLAQASPESEDMLGAIARAIQAGKFGIGEGAIFLHTLLSAGGESTSSLLGSAVRILADNRDLQQRLREEPSLIPKFVDEALRLESPFRHHLRSVPRDTQLGGVDIPTESTVLMMWGAANRDPAAYPDPDVIKLDRTRGHLAFGRGIHTCVGNPLAKLEARVVIEELLARTSAFSVQDGVEPKWENNLMVRRYESLPMVFE